MNILIIEDEIITATDLKRILEKNGHHLLPICRSYSDVQRVFQHHEVPDLLLVDINLRNSTMDGIQIATEISENFVLPIIYLTSRTDPETFRRAKHTFPAAYLFKPFRQEELVFQVELAYEHYMVNKPASPNPATSESLFFPHKKGHQKISKKSIQFIKADGSYVKVYIVNEHQPLLFSMNIGYITQFFIAQNFYKLSRSYIVNLEQIDRFDQEFIYFENSGEKVPIPQAQRRDFLRKIALAKTPQR